MKARLLLILFVMAVVIMLAGCATTGNSGSGANNLDHCVNPASLCYNYRSSG